MAIQTIQIADKTTLDNVSNNIGKTDDISGGTATGTIMGKLNKLISDLATHVSVWTSTKAEAIDTVKTDTDEIKALLSVGKQFGSAIEVGSITLSETETIINGKGIVFLYSSAISNPHKFNITVDGVSIASNIIIYVTTQIEFKNSIVLSISRSPTSSTNAIYVLY